jgi:hypothetical protein
MSGYDVSSQQKVMAAIMLALKNSCQCDSCMMLREVADTLISQLKTAPVGGVDVKAPRRRS